MIDISDEIKLVKSGNCTSLTPKIVDILKKHGKLIFRTGDHITAKKVKQLLEILKKKGIITL